MADLVPGTNLSHYRIIIKLGAGGMGDVYLAQDTRLDRKVALKLLSEALAIQDAGMQRFVQEAKSASALNHPNIITIHEIGEIDNRHFIASEFIEGETLRTRIKRGRLSLAEVLDIVIQIASALDAAHDAKIIHRDIKPENVMIRPDGLVKVVDFGIAKVSASPLSAHNAEATTIREITSPGMIVGTTAYMSPEQARGKTLDTRSDIFSFGMLFYEILTGRNPFQGNTPMEAIGAILHREPFPIRQLLPGLPPEIERVVAKLLKKDCTERYQTAREVLIDLKNIRRELDFQDKLALTALPAPHAARTQVISVPTLVAPDTAPSGEYRTMKTGRRGLVIGAGLLVLLLASAGIVYLISRNRPSPATENVPVESIAVLPFQNRSTDAETDYLSEGLAESLIYGLSQLPRLKVSPTNSVFRYKGKEIDPVRIGNELGVNAVLTGHFFQRGNELSLSVELVDVRVNKLLWGKQYDRKLVDLLTTQKEIATEITQNLRLKLSGADERRVTRHYANDPESYQLYLKGHYYASRYTKEGFNKGIEYFEQAIAKDNSNALAYSGLAFCYLNQTDWVFAPKDSVPKARQAVANALRIDDALAEAHTMNAMVLLQYDWDWLAAEREFRRAVELDPNYALGRSFLAWYLAAMGRFNEAVEEDKRALDLDPLSAAVNADLGWDLYLARRYDEAINQLRKAIDLEPNYWVSHVLLGRCYEQTGKREEALVEFQKARQIENSIPEVVAALGHGYAVLGRQKEALQIISELQARSKKEFIPSYSIATVYVGLGMKEQALQYLIKTYEEGSYYNIHLKVEPILDPVRADPRFADIVRRVGL